MKILQHPAKRLSLRNCESLTAWPVHFLRRIKWWHALPLVLGAGLVSSCSFLGVKREVKELSAHGVISVQVINSNTLEHGFGIYFLEPYDPHRLPVLFVYGISGSPQDWRMAMEKLDRRKYQAWFAYYPSGIRLDKVANGLATAVLHLKQQHGFDRMAVVAHSMGGLVSRGVIQRVVKQAGTNFIPEFFRVSTPWGGAAATESAVKHLKYPVPSWRDMAPGSEYLQEILSQPLPTGTRHDLIFSFQHSDRIGLPPENDGGVGVASELYEPVQVQAATVFGLHLSHMEIPNSPITFRRIEQRLAP